MVRREEFGVNGGGGMYGFPNLVRVITTFDHEDGDVIALTGYDGKGRKHIFRHMVFRVDEIVDDGIAASLGVKPGDILCGVGDDDLLSVSSPREMSGVFCERESVAKRLVVARKNDIGGFDLLTFNLPKGKMGIKYSQRPISDKDHLELVRAKAK